MLNVHFTILTIFGIWCPAHWSQSRKIMHTFYALFVAMIMCSLVSFQLARLIYVQLSFNEFNDTFYFILSTSGTCFKFFLSLAKRDKISRLLSMFQVECCQVRDDFEDIVKKTYDRICKMIVLGLLVFVELTILIWLIGRTVGGIESRQLPYEILQPFDLSNPVVYWLSYVHHMLAGFLFAGISITIDATVTGFMLQLCGQLEILKHRLDLLSDRVQQTQTQGQAELAENFLLKEIIAHHVYIYSLAEILETTFNGIISIQFYISALEICVSVYQLTVRSTKILDLLMNLFFVVCVIGQLYTYCHFGNELTLKSRKFSDALYNSNWMPLPIPLKKNLTLMILRSSKPIEISSGAIVHLTMENFTSVVKFAYSFYNFLKSTT